MPTISDVFKRLLNLKPNENGVIDLADCSCVEASTEIYVSRLALHVCIKLLSDAIAKSEFKTYREYKQKRDDEFYLWNIAPNRNQGKEEFLHELLFKLLTGGEALVLPRDIAGDTELLVAESFNREESSTTHDKFTDIVTRGNKQWRNTFARKDVMYFHYSNQRITALMLGVETLFKKLFAAGIRMYKKGVGEKYRLDYGDVSPGDAKEKAALENYISTHVKSFMAGDTDVIPIGNGYTLESLSTGRSSASSSGYSDISGMIDKVFAMYFNAFGIPLQFLTSTVEGVDGAYKQFMTNAVAPLACILQNEINRKRFEKEEYLAGTYLEVDTDKEIYHDKLAVADAIDKLVSSGTLTINDIRALLNEPPINEPFANTYYMTRNYAPASDVARAVDSS